MAGRCCCRGEPNRRLAHPHRVRRESWRRSMASFSAEQVGERWRWRQGLIITPAINVHLSFVVVLCNSGHQVPDLSQSLLLLPPALRLRNRLPRCSWFKFGLRPNLSSHITNGVTCRPALFLLQGDANKRLVCNIIVEVRNILHVHHTTGHHGRRCQTVPTHPAIFEVGKSEEAGSTRR